MEGIQREEGSKLQWNSVTQEDLICLAYVFVERVGYPSVAVVKCHDQKHLKSLLWLMVLDS